MFDLAGKTALVTGATGGIGGSVAKALHARGADVILSGRNQEKLDKLAGELGGNSHVLPADLSSPEGVDELIDKATAAREDISILVNNAGLTRDNLAMRMKNEDWQQVIDVNLTAPYLLAKGLLRTMMKKRFGRIINVTSVVGITGNPGQTNYCASKAGMIGWSKSLAQETATRGITVNCIAPGFIATAMTEELKEDQKAQINAKIPAGRMGSSDDIAAAAVFLASDESAYITGQTIHVNGGMAMI